MNRRPLSSEELLADIEGMCGACTDCTERARRGASDSADELEYLRDQLLLLARDAAVASAALQPLIRSAHTHERLLAAEQRAERGDRG